MLKEFTLVVTMTLAIPTMAIHNEPSGAQAAKQGQNDTRNPNLPAGSITNNQATSYYEQPSEPKPRGWHKLVTWPEGVTAWLVMLTLGALVWQSYETRRSAKAAQKSADISANAQRAWLLCTNVSFQPRLDDYAGQGLPIASCMVVSFENSGASPAELVRAEIVPVLVPADYVLSANPSYDGKEVEGIAGGTIGPGTPRIMTIPIRDRTDPAKPRNRTILTAPEIKYLSMGRLRLICWGKIEYLDTSGQARTTQFGYEWYARASTSDTRPEAMYRAFGREYNFTS